MKPLSEGWWHLSLEEIRAGESIDRKERPDVVADQSAAAPRLRLKEGMKHGQKSEAAKTGSPDSMFRGDFSLEEFISSQSERPASRPSPADTPTNASRDTTLRDYTTATTRALAKASAAGGTNVFRPLSPMQPVKGLDFGLFNRPQQEGAPQPKEVQDKSTKDPTPDVTSVVPGSSYYGVPTSPLEVVHASFASPQLQHLPDPYADATTPAALPAGPAPDNEGKAPASSTPAAATQNPNSSGQPQTATNSQSGSKTNAIQTITVPPVGYQPLGGQAPLAPSPTVFRRSSGPNASGFYEPKSITDLQMGR